MMINRQFKKFFYILRYKIFVKSFILRYEIIRWRIWYRKNEHRLGNTNFIQNSVKSLRPKTIVFIIPGTAVSGGIAVVLRHANSLLKSGYDVRIFSQSNHIDVSWFKEQKVPIFPYKKCYKKIKNQEVDIMFATSWTTAYPVIMSKAKRKIYFVQSDESRFHSSDRRKIDLILSTYALPMEYMTEAVWIQKWLKESFNYNAYYVPNGIDLKIFKKNKNIISSRKNKVRVLLEGAINIPYKGMDDAYNAVKNLDCELWIVSNNGKPHSDWKYNRFFENVPFNKMNEIYSSCDIFLKMSRVEGFFGPPMEAMACGCAVVVGKVSGFDEYIIHEKNALVVEKKDIVNARNAVQKLITDKKTRKKLIAGGYKTVKQWSWEKSYNLLERVILSEKPVKYYTKNFPKKYR